ncbi:gluconate 2-dehydrogenase subunit 3 family protein [Pseudozobellia thermophila]|uniref:Gluconate 2-dehydrogenase subunit 3 n=1 Tax=Pseudozobellia thermophila TaxID=192903 RepID=A0A1M6FNY0_9FLAO|nr:gluconate 2-dehydrogenase subunit 3 family protein [Pseudozobellia thermophila]SHI99380.1 Gluconate 2-dehydrogenase subunit 3 [Pseudozobellia thermophila]
MDRRKVLKQTGLLAGATVFGPSLFSLLQSCREEPRLDWKPEFFTEEEALTIAALLDAILPRTETPGALDVKADMFIDKVIAHTYDEKEQQGMRDQIAEFNAQCVKKHGSNFSDLGEAEKNEALKTAEANSGKFSRGVWGTAVGEQEPIGFYRAFKSMALWAYTTSEEIGEKVLNYDPIPGGYEPCKPLSEVGNRWSL